MILKIDLKIVKLNDALRKMQKCQFCGKQYKRIGSFKKHLNLCYLLHSSKETIEKDVEENNNEPTMMELYYIVQTLLKKNNKLEERIEYLEGKINRRKRKIKITSWLGQQQFDTITFADFINKDKLIYKDVLNIFKYGYVDGYTEIIKNRIDAIKKVDDESLPIKAYKEKKNTIYYKNEETQKWTAMKVEDLHLIIMPIQRCMFVYLNEWVDSIGDDKIYGEEYKTYVANKQSVTGAVDEKAIDKQRNNIYNQIYNHIKKSINSEEMTQIVF